MSNGAFEDYYRAQVGSFSRTGNNNSTPLEPASTMQ